MLNLHDTPFFRPDILTSLLVTQNLR